MIGRTFGHYRIEAKLGAGSMGEVYRALDARLGRDVAIKVRPPTVLADPDRRIRCEREARVLASLNHPTIGSIYGLEEHDGVDVPRQVSVSANAVLRSTISPRAAIARASAIVTRRDSMSSSSSGLWIESGAGARRSDTLKKIISSSQ